MKKRLLLFCVAALLSACAAPPAPVQVEAEETRPAISSSAPDPTAEDTGNEEPEDELETVYEPAYNLSPKELVEAYFEQQYLAWSNLEHIDISSILDMENSANRNMLKWSEYLTRRRRLLLENGFCHVDTEQLPYVIEYDEAPEDDRMELWREWMVETGTDVLHFRIRGEKGKAYPPIMAVNSQHTMFFKEIDGRKKISLHYFPGSVRKFTRAGALKIPDEETIREQLKFEFAPRDSEPAAAPVNSLIYDGDQAAEYARRFTEDPNPDFYQITDWVGNCANFVSQCVWAGFGEESAMTDQWAGNGGGTPAWENVNYFWSYITGGQELHGQELESASELKNGDIIQTRTATIKSDPERFNHMMIVVDEDTLLLAQNSPNCFVYYSDLVNVETRLIRPTDLKLGTKVTASSTMRPAGL